MDSQNAISFRNFASSMGDARVLSKVDAYIQDHLLEVSEQDDFLKLPRLKVKLDYFFKLACMLACLLFNQDVCTSMLSVLPEAAK